MATIIFLYPYPFTEFDYYNYELVFLEKKNKYKIIIHDLSHILSKKKLNESWNTKIYNQSIKFKSIYDWMVQLNKAKKQNKVYIYDTIDIFSFKAFIIKLLIKFSKLPVIQHQLEENAIWSPKKNLKYYFKKVIFHNFRLNVYFIAIKNFLFKKLINQIRYNKLFLMTNHLPENSNKKNIFFKSFHSRDYSNAIIGAKTSSNLNSKKKIIYIDSGSPYFGGDGPLLGEIVPKNNVRDWYKELNIFFDKLENIFKSEVIIIPHSKYKIPNLKDKNLIPYFNNRKTDNSYDALSRLVSNSLFVISKGSTAIAHAVFHLKPVQIIFSSNYKYVDQERKNLFFQGSLIGSSVIDISKFEYEKIKSNLKINQSKYNSYKLKYLSFESQKKVKPNFELLSDLVSN
tara:strand:+ start:641 stop:1837 length:1197 start_codon:yes stop_codon:yes gene_type:complete